MVSPIQKARLVSRAAIKLVDPRTVTVSRGVDVFTIENATIGESRTEEIQNSDNVITEVLLRDYLIDVSDFDFGSGPVAPQVGDVITETINGITRYFEVLPTNGVPEYREHDRDGTTWRIHTKERSTVTEATP